jgi:Mu-like prophage major head subunit gpT
MESQVTAELRGPAGARFVAMVPQPSVPASAGEFQAETADLVQLRGGPALFEAAGDSASVPRISGLAYSGGAMHLPGFGEVPAVIDLAGMTVPTGTVPLLRDHDAGRPVGHAGVRIDAGGVRIEGRLSGVGPDVTNAVEMAGRGYPFQLSVGGRNDAVEFVPKGQKARVNGREFDGPVQVIRRSTLREVSLVSVGADPQTSAAIAAAFSRGLPMTFSQWLVAQGVDETKITAQGRATLEATFNASAAGGAGGGTSPPPPSAAIAATAPAAGSYEATMIAAREEETRRGRITTLVAQAVASDGNRGTDKSKVHTFEVIGRDALANGWTAMQTENAILQARLSGTCNNVLQPDDRNMTPGNVIQAALCQTMGLNPAQLKDHFPPQVIDASTQKHFRIESLHGLIRAAYQMHGMQPPNHRITPEDLRTLANVELRASGTSTYDLPGILSDAANKVAIETYKAVETTWPLLAKNVPLQNFKPHSLYRLTVGGEMEEVAPSGDIKHGTMKESGYSVRAKTFGKIIGITRQDIINDDLAAFTAVPALLTRKALLAVEKAVYRLILENAGNFFSAANKNVSTGVLGLDGLAAAYKAFKEFVDEDGDPTLVAPKYLVVPPALEMVARQLARSVTTVGGTENVPSANPFAEMFEVLASPFLSEAVMLDPAASNETYYLFAPAGDYAAVAVGTLNGNAAPTVEQASYDFDKLGVSTRCYFDFGVSFLDPRGAVRSDGQPVALTAAAPSRRSARGE